MTSPTTQAELGFIAPFFIVRDVMASIGFYRELLGFEVMYIGPDDDPYFAMVKRDGVHLMLKAITPDVQAAPNPTRHPWARWDAYVYAPDPDALADELARRGVEFREPLGINSDRLRGFEVVDSDGYVLYFGRPEPEERTPSQAEPAVKVNQSKAR
jgi:catechol 2,3-dioxygenase-like lactoylglutathione lyase family enzyme